MCIAADYDLTGQVLWPAATLLAEHLACTPDCMTTRKAACELGSGLGLAGLLCGQFCNTVLSDHNAVVLNVLQENAQINTRQHQVRYLQTAIMEENWLQVQVIIPSKWIEFLCIEKLCF